MSRRDQPVKDRQTVTPAGEPIQRLIEGVAMRPARPQEDKRGELVEIFNPAWGFHTAPLVYVYQTCLRPGLVKGWVMHRAQDDRIFHSAGTVRWALYDPRPESPTRGLLNLFTFSERSRTLLVIPRGVYHAVENIGTGDAMFINLPTAPYDHADPDKYRLPLKNDLIPFSFDDGRGW